MFIFIGCLILVFNLGKEQYGNCKKVIYRDIDRSQMDDYDLITPSNVYKNISDQNFIV